MITLIQTVLQKHHKIIFSILLVIIIISFVFTIGSGLPDFTRSAEYLGGKEKFYGFDLKDPNEMSKIQLYVTTDAQMSGTNLRDPRQNEMMMYNQIIALYFAKEWNLRQVNETELAEFIQSRPVFAGQDGKFDKKLFEAFHAYAINQMRIPEATFNEALMVNALTAKVFKILNGPGYVLASEVEKSYKRMNAAYDFSLATISKADYNPDIAIKDETLLTFYNANQENYRVAEAITVSLAKFEVVAKNNLTITDEELLAHYNANMAKFAKTVDGKLSLPKFEEVKMDVRSDYIKSSSARQAHKDADEVVTQIYNSNPKFGSNSVKEILKSKNIALKTMPKIRSTDLTFPKDMPVELVDAAMSLNEDNFYSDAVLAGDAAYIVFFESKEPSYIQKFEEVKEKVTADYKASEKDRLFAEYGQTLSNAAKAAVEGGKSFDEVVKASIAKVEEQKDFTIQKLKDDQALSREKKYILSQNLLNLKQGEVSKMTTLQDTGYIVYISKIAEPKVDANSAEFKKMHEDMQKMYSQRASYDIVGKMLSK